MLQGNAGGGGASFLMPLVFDGIVNAGATPFMVSILQYSAPLVWLNSLAQFARIIRVSLKRLQCIHLNVTHHTVCGQPSAH